MNKSIELVEIDDLLLEAGWKSWSAVSRLGKGSYGTVYKIKRSEANHEFFAALKVLKIPRSEEDVDSLIHDSDEDSGYKYFKSVVDDCVNEIAIMEGLKGAPNVISIEDYQIIRPEEGKIKWTILIRMELLTPVTEYFRNNKITEREIAKLGMDVASAIEDCSKSNLLHRDIKPQNIFISEKYGHFKLGDFGIARRIENSTMSMSKKGTYNYMAPDIYNNTNRHYDTRADIYSLGLVLYFFLNGKKLPFVEDLTSKNLEMALNLRMAGRDLPRPAECRSDRLWAVIRTACSFDPEQRFKTAKAFRTALGMCFQGLDGFIRAEPDPAGDTHLPPDPKPVPAPDPKPVPVPGPIPVPVPDPQPSPAPPVNKPEKNTALKVVLVLCIILIAGGLAVLGILRFKLPKKTSDEKTAGSESKQEEVTSGIQANRDFEVPQGYVLVDDTERSLRQEKESLLSAVKRASDYSKGKYLTEGLIDCRVKEVVPVRVTPGVTAEIRTVLERNSKVYIFDAGTSIYSDHLHWYYLKSEDDQSTGYVNAEYVLVNYECYEPSNDSVEIYTTPNESSQVIPVNSDGSGNLPKKSEILVIGPVEGAESKYGDWVCAFVFDYEGEYRCGFVRKKLIEKTGKYKKSD